MTGPGSSDRSPRRVMVMDKEDIIAVAVDIEEALMKATDSGYKVIELMSPDQVTERLRRNEESWLNGRGRGVVRYDMVQIPSNDPIEDDHAEKIVEIPTSAEGEVSGDWSFWGVFDGHR